MYFVIDYYRLLEKLEMRLDLDCSLPYIDIT